MTSIVSNDDIYYAVTTDNCNKNNNNNFNEFSGSFNNFSSFNYSTASSSSSYDDTANAAADLNSPVPMMPQTTTTR